MSEFHFLDINLTTGVEYSDIELGVEKYSEPLEIVCHLSGLFLLFGDHPVQV